LSQADAAWYITGEYEPDGQEYDTENDSTKFQAPTPGASEYVYDDITEQHRREVEKSMRDNQAAAEAKAAEPSNTKIQCQPSNSGGLSPSSFVPSDDSDSESAGPGPAVNNINVQRNFKTAATTTVWE